MRKESEPYTINNQLIQKKVAMKKLRSKNDVWHKETNNKMAGGSPSLSVITSDVNGFSN